MNGGTEESHFEGVILKINKNMANYSMNISEENFWS